MIQESKLRIVIDSRNALKTTNEVAAGLENLTKKGDQAETQMTAMSASIKSLVGYMGGLLTINKAISMADGYTQQAARIRNATKDAAEYDLVQNRILATANTTYRQLNEAQEVYLSMAGGMRSLGKSTSETLDLVDSLSFSFTHNATRTDQAQSAMDSLSKSMAKGKIDADAWISIVTGADNVIADMAKTTGKSEAEIRKLGAEGKASLSDLIKTLIATRDENERLANNMENSVADGFTKLSNEVTVYLGRTNEATSATGMLAGGLSTLADNLDLVANTGAAIGLGYVTTALLTKGAVVKKSIVDSIARRAADQAEIQSQLQLAAVEVQRARQIEALAIQEVHLARLELNSATTRTERAAATMRLTQAEMALNIANKETSVALETNTTLQNANNASKRAGILTSSSLLGVLGGPAGLGVTVATVAATYLMFKDSTDDANDSLSSQIEVVSELAQKYRELTLAKLINEQDTLEKKLKRSESQSSKAIASLMGVATSIEHSTDKQKKQSEEMNRIATSLRDGAITTGKALIQMRESGFTEAQIKKASAFFSEFDKGKAEANEAGRQLDYIAQQTGIYGEKLDATTKKIADQKARVNALSGDYKNYSDEVGKNIDWLLQQDGALSATAEQHKRVTDAVDAWRKGTIDATDVVKVFKSNLPIDSSLLAGLGDLATKTDKAKKELNTANVELKQVQINGPKAKQGFTEVAAGAKDAEDELAKLNEKLTDFNKNLYDREFDANFKKMMLGKTSLTENQIQAVMEVTQELRKKGIALDSDAAKQLYAKAADIAKIEEQSNKIIEARNKAQREQTEHKTKQLRITQAELEVAKRSAALIESSGLGKYAESKGIPSSVIAGLLAQESRGIRDAKSHTGAIGYFQTTSGYRKQNNMSVADSYDLEKSGKIAIDNIAKVYEKTGDLAQAILSHNAGESGAKQFATTGKVKGSAERNKEVSQYVGKVSRYADIIAGGGGKGGLSDGDSDRAYGEQIKARLELVKQGLSLQEQYESEQAERTKARNEEINLAQQTDQQALIPKIKERYDAEDKLAKLQQEFDVEGHKWTEERKLQYTYDTNVLRLTAEGKFSEDQKKIFEKALKEQYEQEKAFVILARETRIFQYREALMAQAEFVRERYRIEMLELSKIVDIEERRIAMQAKTAAFIRGNLAPVGTPVVESDKRKSNTQLLQEETGRELQAMQNRHLAAQVAAKDNAEELLRIERDYIAAKEQLHTEHNIKLADARQADFENQFSMYSSMISMTGGVFNELMGIVSEYKEENTKTYKTMFAFQKAIAIAQGIVSTELAAVQVMSDPTALTMAQKLMYAGMIRATGYASVGVIAGQMFAGPGGKGYANGGFTGYGGKYEPAGIVHKWEGVLTKEEMMAIGGPQGFEGLRKSIKNGSYANGGIGGINNTARDTHRVGMGTVNAINSGGSGGKNVVQPKVVINNYSSEKVETSTNQDGELMVTIGKMVNSMVDQKVDQRFLKARRQGGELYGIK